MASTKSKATPKSARPTPKRTPKPAVEEDSDDMVVEKTPQTTSKKTPKDKAGRSTKRKRVDPDEVEGEDTCDETPVTSVSQRLLGATTKETTARLTAHFGVEEGWTGYQIYRDMNREMKKAMQKMVWVWVMFASVMEFSGKFGPLAAYSPGSTLGITNFFIEQFGIRPEFCHRYKSPGKTSLFLLGLTAEVAERLLKLPRDWIKLAHGLGCRIRMPHDDPVACVAVYVAGLLPVVSDAELMALLKGIPGVKSVVGGFERVVMENNVATDRVACSLALKSDEATPFDVYDEKFEHRVTVGGIAVRVERRASCLVCGEDSHLQSACSTKQRLVSNEMSTWTFASDLTEKLTKPEASGSDVPKAKKAKKARKAKGKGKEDDAAPSVEARKPGKGGEGKKVEGKV